jgi:hypothetical protein
MSDICPVISILGHSFRANQAYTLILLDRLPRSEREAVIAAAGGDPELYGVLSPRRAGLPVKAVSRDAALLFLSLQEPGVLPEYFRRTLGEAAERAAADLVVGDVLEVEIDGEFVSGAITPDHLRSACPAPGCAGALARLALSAMQWATTLHMDDPWQLGMRLYAYNRTPISPEWAERYPTSEVLTARLEDRPFGSTGRLLDRSWCPVDPRPDNRYWRIWRIRDPRPGDSSRSVRRLPYKIYVSPAGAQICEAFARTVEVFTRLRVPQFKVGGDIYNVLRPDKLVAYLPTRERLDEVGGALAESLEGIPAHGVPFTTEISGDGLLSWGADPPLPPAGSPPRPELRSWRVWITQRLAAALIAAKRVPADTTPSWQTALDFLRREGIDTATWTPPRSFSSSMSTRREG